jgi:hypothetical protein
LSDLHVTDDNLIYQHNGPFYYGRESSVKSSVMAYSIKEREAKSVVDDVTEWSLTADGKHVLAQLSSKELKYYEVGKSEEGKDGKAVSLAGLMTTRVPMQEWHEIFAEVWRRYRDYFYVSNMHGYDWQKLRQKYEPLVDSVGHRADLNYVIAEMISELVIQHAYIEGGDLGLPKRPFVALPGARFALDPASGRYRIATIFAGQNEEEHYRSPLTEVGVDVHVGDYVLAINGRELKAGTDPYELLQAPANQAGGVAGSGDTRRQIRAHHPLPAAGQRNRAALSQVVGREPSARHRDEPRAPGLHSYSRHGRSGLTRIHQVVVSASAQGRPAGRCARQWRRQCVADAPRTLGAHAARPQISRAIQDITGTYPRVVQPGPKVRSSTKTRPPTATFSPTSSASGKSDR